MERKLRFFDDQIEKQNFGEELEIINLQFGSSRRTLVPELDELEVSRPPPATRIRMN